MNKYTGAARFSDNALLTAAELLQIDALLSPDAEEEPQTDGSSASGDAAPERVCADPGPGSADAVLLALDGTEPELATSRSFKELLSLRERGAQAVHRAAVRSRT
jgi:hypothetical protein